MRSTLRLGVATGLIGTLIAAATGQTITHGNATFTLNTSATPGLCDFRPEGGTTTDHLYQNWWWYRVNGVDTREFRFPWSSTGNNGTVGPANVLTNSWTGLGGGAFNATLQYVLMDGFVAGEAWLGESLLLTNASSAPISLSIFNYADIDANGTASSDSGVLMNPTWIRVTDPANTNIAVDFLGTNANAYQVTSFSSLRTLLDDTSITNLNNTGLPFGPGDFTGAFQWDVSIDPGSSVQILEVLAVTPEPASLGLLLCALGLLRRR